MQTYVLSDNTKDNFIPVPGLKSQFAFFPKEEATMWPLKEFYTNQFNTIHTVGASGTSDYLNHSTFPEVLYPSPITGTDYIGVGNFKVPHLLVEKFTDFLYVKEDFENLTGTFESWCKEFYTEEDQNNKIKSLLNGLQLIRVPANKFSIDNTPDYGTYYLKISPKYIQTQVEDLRERVNLKSYKELYSSSLSESDLYTLYQNGSPNALYALYEQGRRKIFKVNKNSFNSTPWTFETSSLQNGRLFGSIVEVWDSSIVEKKQVKVLMEDRLNLGTGGSYADLVLSPDITGYDSPNQIVTLGDVLRIYPRETYFEPIIVQINYSKSGGIENVVAFLQNDIVRNIKNGVMEVYSDEGVVVDEKGNINGEVIQQYHIFKTGNDYEIRKKLK